MLTRRQRHFPGRLDGGLLHGYARRQRPGEPISRAGNVTIAHSSFNTPSTAMPTTRNGRSNNQTMGYSSRANRAIGQQSTKSRHHMMNVSKVESSEGPYDAEAGQVPEALRRAPHLAPLRRTPQSSQNTRYRTLAVWPLDMPVRSPALLSTTLGWKRVPAIRVATAMSSSWPKNTFT